LPLTGAERRRLGRRERAADHRDRPAEHLDGLAGELEGYFAADCAALIREAALTTMRESLEATEVTAAQLVAARQAVRPSLDPMQLTELAGYAAAHGLATS
jgi:SpoVK/Ycf46/Vps4 family AAA+-type ATPase